VGNPSLPPDINLMYGIPLAQNYDGIGIKEYEKKFVQAFPNTNHWGKVDSFNQSSLKRFNISYILSDYDINDTKQSIQSNYTTLIGPILVSNSIETEFIPKFANLHEVRFLPANYNRKNLCVLFISITDKEEKKEILQKKVDCREILDKMYYTIDANLNVTPGRKYNIKFSTNETNPQKSIGIWGDKGRPFVELYFKQENQTYQLLFNDVNIKLFKVPDVNKVIMKGTYTVILDNPYEFSFEYEMDKKGSGEIKKTFYPGWEAYIDGRKVIISNNGPFIGINFPQGKHTVSVQYHPLSFKLGIIFTFAALLILLILSKVKKLF
jgi:hypothetical protein